jgi:nitrate reductase (NAD(P)H)
VNSAVSRPWHDEVISTAANSTYAMSGYAYTGGGRKVIRVEVSLDGGHLWRQAEITRHETPTKAGKYWCWVFWKFEVQTIEFARASEVLVRAWDSSMNTQPSHLTWNLMGMMNNCHFRIKIHTHVDQQGNMGLRFQHPAPVQPGVLGNIGWREEENLARQGVEAAAAPAAAVVVAAKPAAVNGSVGMYTMEEVEQHSTEESCWFVHEGKVYDATPFLEEHPGGAESILISAGMDATDEFNSIHSSKAKGMLKDYYIGELVTAEQKAAALSKAVTTTTAAISLTADSTAGAVTTTTVVVNGTAATAEKELVALDPRKKIAFKLAEKIELSHNVRLFRFALQSPQHKFGLPVGKHVFLYATIGGETVMRAYTPTSQDKDLGHFDLVIKVYRANEHPRFPDGGKMSQYLDTLAVGDTIDVKGPVGHFVYEGRGQYTLNRKPATAKFINLIAGGTGITPCWQVIRTVTDDPEDDTQVSLLLANQCEDDILLREQLEELAEKFPHKFKLWYTLDRPPAEGWKYSSGFINEDMLREHMLPAGPDAIVAMCGPPPMIKFACIPNLEKLGFTEAQLITF